MNIPLKETINICVDKLLESNTKINYLTKESFQSLLELATLDPFFIFDGKYYKQKDAVAMGSPLGPTLASVFLCHLKNNGCLIALLITNLFHAEGILTIHFCYFHLNCT